MAEAADHTARLVMAKSPFPESHLKRAIVVPRDHLHDHVHVVGRANLWCGLIGDPELNGRATDKHDILAKVAQRRCGKLEELYVHERGADGSRRSFSASPASPRSRASPIRMASTKARLCASCASRKAASGTEG